MSPLMIVHATAATVAVVLGGWQLLAVKRGLRHRTLGYLWFAAMAIAALSSFGLKGRLGIPWLGGFSWIHLLSVITLAMMARAIFAAVRRDFVTHRRALIGTYGALISAGVFATLTPGRAVHTLLFMDLPASMAPLAGTFF